MWSLSSHALLVLSALGLCSAGFRVVSVWTPSGPQRLVGAAVLAGAAVVTCTLLLSVFGLAGGPWGYVLLALALWLASLRTSGPDPGARDQAAAAWAALPVRGRLLAGAAAGAWGIWAAWLLRYPALGYDASVYHFLEPALWLSKGSAALYEPVSYDFPFHAYPVTNEVVLTWMGGLGGSFAVFSVWAPVCLALLGLATWSAVRTLGVDRLPAALCTLCVLTLPIAVRALNEPGTDLPAVAWTACAASLSAGSLRRPSLLPLVIVAGGLAVGTKTTALIPVVAFSGVALYANRFELRRLAAPLAGATVLAVVVGGLWYLRNLIEHGSPLWPFLDAPWGTPTPTVIDQIDSRFLERPLDTLDGRLDDYASLLGGAIVLIAGGLAMAVAGGSRAARAAGAVTAVALLAWTAAPVTGVAASAEGLSAYLPFTGARYLLPAAFVATLTLALATAAGHRRLRILALCLLGAGLGWNAGRLLSLGFPFVPSLPTLALGALLGAGAAAALEAISRRRVPLPRGRTAVVAGALALALVAGAGLAAAQTGYVARHARVTGTTAPAQSLIAWFLAQPGFEDGTEPVAFASRPVVGPLAGDTLGHRVELIGADENCASVARRARRGWVVLTESAPGGGDLRLPGYRAGSCLRGERALRDDGTTRVYRVR